MNVDYSDYFSIMSPADRSHSLLEGTTPPYSPLTVRRAFIVWLHMGQRNDFKQVCEYYHALEALERTLSPEQRATSRAYEEILFEQTPPSSKFLQELYPCLYSKLNDDLSSQQALESIRNEALHQGQTRNPSSNEENLVQNGVKLLQNGHNVLHNGQNGQNLLQNGSNLHLKGKNLYDGNHVSQIEENQCHNGTNTFPEQCLQKLDDLRRNNQILETQYAKNLTKRNLEKFKEIEILEVSELEKKQTKKVEENSEKKSGTTKQEILEVSQMIKFHCKNHLIPLNKFLSEFELFANRAELRNTVHNVNFFIKRKMIHAEMKMIADQKRNFEQFETEFDLISFENSPKRKDGDSLKRKCNGVSPKRKLDGSIAEKQILDCSIDVTDSDEAFTEGNDGKSKKTNDKSVNGDVLTIINDDKKNVEGFSSPLLV